MPLHGISDCRGAEVTLYYLRLPLRTHQIDPHVAHQFFFRPGSPPSRCVRLHILIQIFIRIQLRTVFRQKEKLYLFFMPPYPL